MWSAETPSAPCRGMAVTFLSMRSCAVIELPRRGTLPVDVVLGSVRPGPAGLPRPTPSCGVGRREPVLAKATGPVPGAPAQAPTGRRFHSLADGDSESMVRLARRARQRQAGHAHSLATQRIPDLLTLEVEADRKTLPSQGPPETDPRYGCGESDVGTRTHRRRVETEARYPGLAPHGREVLGPGRPSAHA